MDFEWQKTQKLVGTCLPAIFLAGLPAIFLAGLPLPAVVHGPQAGTIDSVRFTPPVPKSFLFGMFPTGHAEKYPHVLSGYCDIPHRSGEATLEVRLQSWIDLLEKSDFRPAREIPAATYFGKVASRGLIYFAKVGSLLDAAATEDSRWNRVLQFLR